MPQPAPTPAQPGPAEPPFPPVSVVIVSRNRIADLRRCLDALMKSDGLAHIEIIIVDLASADGSRDLDTEFPQLRIIRMPRNFGKTLARNNGVRTAANDLVFFLDPGVAVEPSAIAALARTFDADPACAAAAPQVLNADGSPGPGSYPLPDRTTLASWCLSGDGPFAARPVSASVTGNPPETRREIDETATESHREPDGWEAAWDGALMVRRQFIAGMNYFDEKRFFEHFAELDLFRQIHNAGKHLRVISEARCTLFSVPAPKFTPEDRALLACDRVAGASAFLDKLSGGGFSFHISMIFKALGGAFAPSGAPRMKVVSGLLSGVKIDGTQQSSVI